MLTVSRDQTIGEIRFDGQTLSRVRTYRGHTDDCMDVRASPDRTRFASVGYDGTLRSWRRGYPDPVATHELSGSRLFAVWVDWKTGMATVGGMDGLRRTDLESGRVVASAADQPMISTVSRAGRHLVTTDAFGGVRLRDPLTLRPRWEACLYEWPHDDYNDTYFRRLSGFRHLPGTAAPTYRDGDHRVSFARVLPRHPDPLLAFRWKPELSDCPTLAKARYSMP